MTSQARFDWWGETSPIRCVVLVLGRSQINCRSESGTFDTFPTCKKNLHKCEYCGCPPSSSPGTKPSLSIHNTTSVALRSKSFANVHQNDSAGLYVCVRRTMQLNCMPCISSHE